MIELGPIGGQSLLMQVISSIGELRFVDSAPRTHARWSQWGKDERFPSIQFSLVVEPWEESPILRIV